VPPPAQVEQTTGGDDDETFPRSLPAPPITPASQPRFSSSRSTSASSASVPVTWPGEPLARRREPPHRPAEYNEERDRRVVEVRELIGDAVGSMTG